MQCPRCGKQIGINDAFCTSCGVKLVKNNQLEHKTKNKLTEPPVEKSGINSKVVIAFLIVVVVLLSGILFILLNKKNNDSMENQTTVEVATAAELLDNIGSNKKIILTSNYYNLSEVQNVNNTFVERQVNWDDTYLDSYIIKNVVNMTIEGDAEIAIDDKMADVLSFEKCKNITLSGLTIGHTTSYEQYRCEGAVATFNTCDNICINNCNFYGCGAVGIFADSVNNLHVTNSKIYDCTYTGIWLADKSTATINKTEFFDSVHKSGFLTVRNSTINCTDCNIHDIICNDFGMFIDTFDSDGEASNISFTNCSFSNNIFDFITNDDGNKKILFDDCSFQNNAGNMNHYSVVYK